MFDPASEDERQTTQGDVYSLACVFIEVYTGETPWHEINRRKIPSLVLSGARPKRPTFHDGPKMSDPIWEIVERCWAQDPSKRPTADQVLTRFEQVVHPLGQSQLLRSKYLITREIGPPTLSQMKAKETKDLLDVVNLVRLYTVDMRDLLVFTFQCSLFSF